jgi:hypothetical protein
MVCQAAWIAGSKADVHVHNNTHDLAGAQYVSRD